MSSQLAGPRAGGEVLDDARPHRPGPGFVGVLLDRSPDVLGDLSRLGPENQRGVVALAPQPPGELGRRDVDQFGRVVGPEQRAETEHSCPLGS
jgi:hypothetical protein